MNVLILRAADAQSCYFQGLLYAAVLGRTAQAQDRQALNVSLAHFLGPTNPRGRGLEKGPA